MLQIVNLTCRHRPGNPMEMPFADEAQPVSLRRGAGSSGRLSWPGSPSTLSPARLPGSGNGTSGLLYALPLLSGASPWYLRSLPGTSELVFQNSAPTSQFSEPFLGVTVPALNLPRHALPLCTADLGCLLSPALDGEPLRLPRWPVLSHGRCAVVTEPVKG